MRRAWTAASDYDESAKRARTGDMGGIAGSGYAAGVDVESLAHAVSGSDDGIADGAVGARGRAVRVEVERGVDAGLSAARR